MTASEATWQSRLRPVLLEMARGTPPEDALILLPLTNLDDIQTQAEMRCLVRASSPALDLLRRAEPDRSPSQIADQLAALLDGLGEEEKAMLEDLVVDLSKPAVPGRALRSLRGDGRAMIAGLGNLLLASARCLSPSLGYPPEGILEGCFAYAEGRFTGDE